MFNSIDLTDIGGEGGQRIEAPNGVEYCEGCPFGHGEVWGGAVPLPRNFFIFFYFEMARFGAIFIAKFKYM